MVLALIAGGVLAANPATPAAPPHRQLAPAAPAPAPAPVRDPRRHAGPGSRRCPAARAARRDAGSVADAGRGLPRRQLSGTRRRRADAAQLGLLLVGDPLGDQLAVLARRHGVHRPAVRIRLQQHLRHRVRHQRRRPHESARLHRRQERLPRHQALQAATGSTRPSRRACAGCCSTRSSPRYNYWAIVHIMRNLWFGVQETVQAEKGGRRHHRREREGTPPNEFICSGLVQIGFVEAVLEYIKAGQLPPSAINDVVFEPEAATRLPDKADWAYLDPESSKTTAVLFRKQNYRSAAVGDAGGSRRERQARVAVLHQGRACLQSLDLRRGEEAVGRLKASRRLGPLRS